MTKALREMLNQITEFVRDHKDGKDLYRILTALRGPDDGDFVLKNCTTAILRDAVGFRNDKSYDTNADNPKRAKFRAEVFHKWEAGDNDNSHFLSHIKTGFRAVGLNLHRNNNPRLPGAKKSKRARKGN
jgi:hypothetical protein